MIIREISSSTIEYRKKSRLNPIGMRKRLGGPGCISFTGHEYWHESQESILGWSMRKKDRLRSILNDGRVIVVTLTGELRKVIVRGTLIPYDLTQDIIRAIIDK